MINDEAVITICTRDRPDELRALLASIGRSRFKSGSRPAVRIVVVENGPERAGFTAEELSSLAGWPVSVIHEPRPGVAFARNAAVRHRGHAPLLLMVDDDQIVTRGWLDAHLTHAALTDADVLTGPVLTLIPEQAPDWAALIWRDVPRYPTGTPRPSFLGGNVCFRSKIFDEVEDWFDERRPRSTADDTSFGRRLVERGYRIEWNDRAVAWEPVHAARLTRRWMVERYLSFGGFEAEYAIERRGRRDVLRSDAPQVVKNLALGLGNGCRCVVSRDPEHEAAAIALTSQALGWFGGLCGLRIADYRQVTSRSPLAHEGAR